MKTSVLISNYNYANHLPAAIHSVLGQTVPAHEIIVVDDGSTDHSRDIIDSFGDAIIPLFQENAGQAAAISAGFARSTGDIVMLLDADDLFHPHKIEILQGLYAQSPATGWIFHDLKELPLGKVVLDNIPISKDITPRQIDQKAAMIAGHLGYDSPATSGLTFRRSFMQDFFPMPHARSITLSDHYIKFYCLATAQGLHVSEPLGVQVLHDKNLYTGKQSTKALATRSRIFANTAMALERICPHTRVFCHNLMSESLKCALKAKIYKDIKAMTKEYFSGMSRRDRLKIKLKAFLKYLLKK
ncbi:MAG: glycosyltransferase family 2 protein [Rhodospirillales bacterium]|nr:glycosyltransferase family 2 protein [Rhodospirillales bacterium]